MKQLAQTATGSAFVQKRIRYRGVRDRFPEKGRVGGFCFLRNAAENLPGLHSGRATGAGEQIPGSPGKNRVRRRGRWGSGQAVRAAHPCGMRSPSALSGGGT